MLLSRGDICALFAHLTHNGDLRMVNIHLKIMIIRKYSRAYLLAYLLRMHGEALIGAFGFDLKGTRG